VVGGESRPSSDGLSPPDTYNVLLAPPNTYNVAAAPVRRAWTVARPGRPYAE